ncbi:MAG: neutral/alkaline non-lysosomal ceramidase N-terminal domain-containing protein [Cyclobacteriaceae bacterium]|nr:neutral/alkaline non-lysosomal ceramidase N-terminal domain-containing protein [Cyclobacteriaceae bacterium]
MRLRKILRVVLVVFVVCSALFLFLVAVSVAPINRTPDREQLYSLMMNTMDTLGKPEGIHQGFSIGFAKENITPSYRTATAGYGNRMGKLFTSVHDSIYVRTMVIDNGAQRIAVVSADLLIIPPTVAAVLEKELPDVGFTLDNTYLGAVHTHNGIGNWGEGVISFLYGSYEDSIVHFIANKIKLSIQHATMNTLPATLKAGVIPLQHTVHNRLIDNGPVDSLLRVVEVQRSDSSKLLLMSFTAHATCLDSRDLHLSADYPGKLVALVEDEGYTFAMFMAGSVGSHTGSAPVRGEPCIDWMASEVSRGFLTNRMALSSVQDSTLVMHRIPLLLGDSQAKVLKNWRIRPWLFALVFGDYPAYLTVLRLGNIVMLGTPCDFSGEFDPSLDLLAASHGLQLMVTSFNGGYVGYVTPDKYYDVDHYETRLMNWYGPGNGEYMKRCMEQLLLTVAGNKEIVKGAAAND